MSSNFFREIEKNITLDKVSRVIDIINLESLDLEDYVISFSIMEKATTNQCTFLSTNQISGNKYESQLMNTEASFCLISQNDYIKYKERNKKISFIITKDPYLDFLKLYDHFHKLREISKNNILIDEGVIVYPGVHIIENVVIKKGSIIYPGATLQNVIIDENCIIHPNVSIGQDGFGYIHKINENGLQILKIKHFGNVIIGKNVEIGSNTCVDRGLFEDTIIEDNVKLDNLIQIAHNVIIKKNTVIAGHVAIGGSSTVGQNCMIGGKVAIAGHLNIGDNSIVYGSSNVSKSCEKNTKLFASWPAENYSDWVRKVGFFNILYNKKEDISTIIKIIAKIKQIIKKVKAIFM